jgi:hypothetical protein
MNNKTSTAKITLHDALVTASVSSDTQQSI